VRVVGGDGGVVWVKDGVWGIVVNRIPVDTNYQLVFFKN
jgi:hypothetical protein